jgi:hypothetical protein
VPIDAPGLCAEVVPGVPDTDETPLDPGLVWTVRPVPSEGSLAMRGVPVSTGPPDCAPVFAEPVVVVPFAGVRGLEAGVCGEPVPICVST